MSKIAQKLAKMFDVTTGNSPAVHLSLEEANTFIDYVVDESAVFKQARVERMNKATKNIRKIGISSDIFHKATSGTALATNKYAETKNLPTVTLTSQEIIGTVQINDDELEDNIEGAAFKDHFMRMVAKQAAMQLERTAIYGRKVTNATDTYHMFDGWKKMILATGNVVDFADTALFTDRYVDKNKLSRLYKSIPTKYRNGLSSFYMNDDLMVDFEMLYEQQLNYIDRKGAFGKPFTATPLMNTEGAIAKVGATQLTLSANVVSGATTINLVATTGLSIGDEITIALGKDKEFTTTIANIALLVVTLDDAVPFDYDFTNANENKVIETTSDAADILLSANNNLIVGIQRDITVEMERSARQRCTFAVITMRMDVAVENPEAAVFGINAKVK